MTTKKPAASDAAIVELKTALQELGLKATECPKSMAAAADLLYATVQDRLVIQKQAEAKAKIETALKTYIINNLPKSEASGIAGKKARVTLGKKVVPQVQDWNALYGYIVKGYKKDPGVFSLLQRRLGDGAVKEIWEAGKEVPGVGTFETITVSINKL
jgi:hypothetical protein